MIGVNNSQRDIQYYKLRAIQINTKNPLGSLPTHKVLRTSLQNFGSIRYCRTLCIRDGVDAIGPANTAIVVFDSQNAAKKALESSRSETDGSFWQTDSIAACTLRKTGDINRVFLTKIVPSLIQTEAMSNGQPSNHNASSQGTKRHQGHSSSYDGEPPAKRSKIKGRERTSNNSGVVANIRHVPAPEPPISPAPETPEWMRARIAQLEAELDNAKAARDMATSEQDVIRMANQAEQSARREAMSQKSAAEAALSRKEVEQNRLRVELESVLCQKSALLCDVETLRGQLATAEDKLKLARSSSDESTKSDERIKTLETELEGVRDREHKLQLYKLRIERQQSANIDTTGIDDMKGKVKQLKADIQLMKSDLASTQEQLESTQKSLESKERKCSSTRAKYENIKVKLGAYKARLENERVLMEKLRETLTPAAYKSLGATHETLGAFLSAMGLPPVSDEGNNRPKEESE